MNTFLINHYGIKFDKRIDGEINITANSLILALYMTRFIRQKNMLKDLILTLDLALAGNLISPDDKEWSLELGLQLYTGVIQTNMTFDIFLEDQYDQTLENFPLFDINEILKSLLEFIS